MNLFLMSVDCAKYKSLFFSDLTFDCVLKQKLALWLCQIELQKLDENQQKALFIDSFECKLHKKYIFKSWFTTNIIMKIC